MFTEAVRKAAFARAGGMCECHRLAECGHLGRCVRALKSGAWQLRRKSENGGDTLDNAEALCERCFEIASKVRTPRQ